MDSERMDAVLENEAAEEVTAGESVRNAPVSREGQRNVPIATLRAALAEVETACNAIVGQMIETQAQSLAVAQQASQEIAEMQSAAEATLQRARLQNEIEVGELRKVVERLTRDLQQQKRAQQERAQEIGHDAPERLASYQLQVQALRAELDAARAESAELARQVDVEKAKHARLMDAIRSVRQTQPASIGIGLAIGDVRRLPEAREMVEAPRDQRHAASTTGATTAEERPSASERQDVSAAVPGKPSQPASGGSALDFDPAEYATRLIEQIQSLYDADTQAHMSFDELVNRLTGKLKYGAAAFARRVGNSAHSQVFTDRLTAVLDEKADTVFGRHLAVAVYECERGETGEHAQVA
jgi:hypothetical protein